MICSNCGHENREGRKFCEECGAPLTSQGPRQATPSKAAPASIPSPASFAAGRNGVKKFLGEGGKKLVKEYFSLTKITRQTEDIYSSCMRGK